MRSRTAVAVAAWVGRAGAPRSGQPGPRVEWTAYHHRCAFTSLTVCVPVGVAVIKARRRLTHDGAPDLR